MARTPTAPPTPPASLTKRPATAIKPAPLTSEFLATVQQAAEVLYKGGLVPGWAKRVESLAVVILAGHEIGLKPVQAVSSMMLVNGRAVIYGDAALSLVRASGLLVSIVEHVDQDSDHGGAIASCTVTRAGEEPRPFTFSIDDAKRARLWGKAGPWSQYPERMLMFRARGFALRDVFGDVLCGLVTAEEAQDIPTAVVVSVKDAPAADPAPAAEAHHPGPPALPPVADPPAEPMIRPDQAETLAAERETWFKRLGFDDAESNAGRRKEAWTAFLAEQGVKSARELTAAAADAAIDALKVAGLPF